MLHWKKGIFLYWISIDIKKKKNTKCPYLKNKLGYGGRSHPLLPVSHTPWLSTWGFPRQSLWFSVGVPVATRKALVQSGAGQKCQGVNALEKPTSVSDTGNG